MRQYREDQGTVWDGVARMSEEAGVHSETGAMRDVYKAKKAVPDEYLKSFTLESGQRGLLVFIGGEVVITMLPNSPEVREAVLGRASVIEGIKPGSIVVDMSSIAPLVSGEVSARLADKGVVILDASVSGGEPKAIDGSLAIMII